jgi:hypothetical protein
MKLLFKKCPTFNANEICMRSGFKVLWLDIFTESLQLRRNEKRYLNDLNGSYRKKNKDTDNIIRYWKHSQNSLFGLYTYFVTNYRFPLDQRVKERVDKANVIIQSHFGCLDMHGESYLLTEGQRLIKVWQNLAKDIKFWPMNFTLGTSISLGWKAPFSVFSSFRFWA